MKLIGKDNYDRETISDHLIAENVNRNYGELIKKLLNEYFGEKASTFVDLVQDDYKLYKFEP